MAKNQISKVTNIDVAAEANVSYGTVSRVINNDIHVKQETRDRVLTTMQRLGYVANRQARSLAGGKSNSIGVLVPDLGTGYIGELLRGIDAELGLNDLDLILYTTHRTAIKEANYVANLARGMVDGLLLVLPRSPADFIGTLTERNFPFVLIDHQGIGPDCPAVGAANWQGGFTATEYLIKLGHKRIGFITGWMDLVCALDRLDGYRSALRTNHIPERSELIYEGNFFQPDGFTGVSTLLDLADPPTAIFASNDVMAMGVMLSAAGSLQWYRDSLPPGMSFDELLKEAGDVPAGCEGLQFLPYLSGERTPYADPLARGAFVGLTLRNGCGHMTRAVLEGSLLD